MRVVAEGAFASSASPPGAGPGFGLEAGRYLLAVGAIEPRKGPLLLAAAYVRARERGLSAQLAFAGEGRLARRLSGITGIKLLGRVSDAELDTLYRGALALVAPSLLEGYGLPLREALARGTPAVVSDLPAFGPELSPAVLRVALGDVGELSEALLAVERDRTLRARLAAAAPAAVAGLTWAEAARETRAVLAEAAAASPSLP